MSLVPTCSANTANLDVVFKESDDVNIRVRIDYVCIGNGNETVSGNFEHWLFTLIVTVVALFPGPRRRRRKGLVSAVCACA